jgi:glycosyltransferase involved in cell wall biosynthesis
MLEGLRVLAIHHDSGLNGAVLLFQSVLEGLARDHGASVSMIFPREGPILPRARRLGPVHLHAPPPEGWARVQARIHRALGGVGRATAHDGYDVIFANSVASLRIVERLHAQLRAPLVVYVHESKYMFRHMGDFEQVCRMLRRADLIFAVSDAVRRTLEDEVRPRAAIVVVSGFAPERPATAVKYSLPSAVQSAIATGAPIVGGVGTMSWYKGTDLFVAVAARMRQLAPRQPLRFIWIGTEWNPEVRRELEHDIKLAGLEDVLMLPGIVEDPTEFFKALAIFLLPSREDSWPLVMLEAAALGVPTVCFQGAGGAEQFLAAGGGRAVPYLDVEAMAQTATRYLLDPALRAEDSRIAQALGNGTTPAGQVRRIAQELSALFERRPTR